jgi:hypothetical protein
VNYSVLKAQTVLKTIMKHVTSILLEERIGELSLQLTCYIAPDGWQTLLGGDYYKYT